MSIDLSDYTGSAAGASEDALTRARIEERKRIAGIMDHPKAKGREVAARKLAFSTDMNVEDAAAFLTDLPTASGPSSIGARAADTVITASVDTGEHNPGAGGARVDEADRIPNQPGAVSWSSIADKLNRKI